jgi:hypothetical protein
VCLYMSGVRRETPIEKRSFLSSPFNFQLHAAQESKVVKHSINSFFTGRRRGGKEGGREGRKGMATGFVRSQVVEFPVLRCNTIFMFGKRKRERKQGRIKGECVYIVFISFLFDSSSINTHSKFWLLSSIRRCLLSSSSSHIINSLLAPLPFLSSLRSSPFSQPLSSHVNSLVALPFHPSFPPSLPPFLPLQNNLPIHVRLPRVRPFLQQPQLMHHRNCPPPSLPPPPLPLSPIQTTQSFLFLLRCLFLARKHTPPPPPQFLSPLSSHCIARKTSLLNY